MMLKPALVLLPATLLLASCGKGTDQTSIAPSSDAGSQIIRPGLWETAVRGQVEGMPDLPETTSRACVTAKESDDAAKVFMADIEGRECSAQSFTARDGKLDGKMVCTQDGSQTNITTSGTYSADAYEIVTQISGKVQGAEEPMNLKSVTRGRRIGDC